MMKFLSFQKASSSAWRTFTRFPLVILLATYTSLLMVFYNEFYEGEFHSDVFFIKSFLTGSLGLPFLLMINLFTEVKNKWVFWVGQSLGVIGLVAYFLTLPDHMASATGITYFRYLMMVIGFHLMVSYSSFLNKENILQFWQFNKTIFLRFLTAIIFSGTLYVGLIIALTAIHELLNFKIHDEYYLDLFILISGIFNTWFFLAGIPLKEKQEPINYPKELRGFAQYVLIPLVIVYLFILYLYGIKICIIRDWPKGWVAFPISVCSVIGIFSYLLLYPLKESQENRWINSFSKYFFIALIPTIFMLWWSIWLRVNEYGITEPRYYLIVLSFWLTGISIYFISSRLKDIKLIPITLSLIALLSFWGPWSAFSVSKFSQINRLKEVLKRHDLFKDGLIIAPTKDLPLEDEKSIISIIDYLVSTHGPQSLQFMTKKELGNNPNISPRNIIAQLGFKSVSDSNGTQIVRIVSKEKNLIVPISGYHMALILSQDYSNPDLSFDFKSSKGEKYNLEIINWTQILISSGSHKGDEAKIDLKPFLSKIIKEHPADPNGKIELPQENLQFTSETTHFNLMVQFQNLSFSSASLENNYGYRSQGYIFIRNK